MRVFHCDHCSQLVFFENVQCLRCQHPLAYFPDMQIVGSLEQDADGMWRSPLRRAQGKRYRLCKNYTEHNICNWAVPENDPHELCLSCRLTRIIPALSSPENHLRWYRLEVAKRRLVYSLQRLQLPITDRTIDPEHGLAFEFLEDTPNTTARVLTGHLGGVITINIAEADDAEREKRRLQVHEPYRTLLGHFRHEIGHYYWDRCVQNSEWLEPFREKFGDERQDYSAALSQHYQNGPPTDWQDRFVSAYASVHPWEDWAETFAHFLHMTDALETAAVCGLSLRPRRSDEPTLPTVHADIRTPFEELMSDWFALTYALNNLSRGLGHADAYPFVLSNAAMEKLRFVQDFLTAIGKTTAQAAAHAKTQEREAACTVTS